MNKRLKRYTLNEEIIQKILKLMHKGEEAELTVLKHDYPNEYDVAEERLTDKLPDELQPVPALKKLVEKRLKM
jgi:hypothetical protein